MRGGGNESIRSHETRGQLARLSHRQAWDQSLAVTHGNVLGNLDSCMGVGIFIHSTYY